MNNYLIRFSLAAILILLMAVAIPAEDKKGKPQPVKPTQVSIPEASQTKTQTDQDAIEETSSMAPVFRNPAEGEEIHWQVISAGGFIGGTSPNYGLSGTVSQTAVGSGTSDNYGLSHGFWQPFEVVTDCLCSPGEANGDSNVNIGDAVYLISYIFKGGPPPTPFETCSGDANCDCQCNVGDAVYIISYVFKGGPPPCSCGTWIDELCGPSYY